MDYEVEQVKIFLKSKGVVIPFSNEWLNSCIQCFVSQGISNDVKVLQKFVYDQWLLADLRDVGASTLPENINEKEKYVLNGRFAVQINYAINISVAFHKQMQLIRRPESEKNLEVGAEEKEAIHKGPLGHRAYKMEITDGVTTVTGFEDKPLYNVKDIIPGEKALIIGPVEIKKGVFMLKNNNLQMLGGEVDTLLIPNAVENILARFLRLPENPDPYKQKVRERVVQNSISLDPEDEAAMSMLADAMEKESPSVVSQQNPPKNQTAKKQTTMTNFLSQKRITPQPVVPLDLFEDGFDFPDDEEFRMLAACHPSKATTNFLCSQEITDLNDPPTLKKKLEESYGSKNNAEEETWFKPPLKSSLEPPRPSSEKGKILVDSLGPPFQLEDYPLEDSQEKPSESPGPEFYQHFPPKTYPSERRVNCKVIKLSQKLGLKDENWSLSAIVCAKGVDMEMDFSSQVLDKIFGITGKEISAKRKEFKENPQAKQNMNEILKSSQQRIKNLNCEMVVKFNSFIANPVITDIVE